jgi:hypothetical protein
MYVEFCSRSVLSEAMFVYEYTHLAYYSLKNCILVHGKLDSLLREYQRVWMAESQLPINEILVPLKFI